MMDFLDGIGMILFIAVIVPVRICTECLAWIFEKVRGE